MPRAPKLSGAANKKRRIAQEKLIQRIRPITAFGVRTDRNPGFPTAAAASAAAHEVFNDVVEPVDCTSPSFDLFSSDEEDLDQGRSFEIS